MRLTERDAQKQRESILNAAFEVFTTVGYSAAKMDMVSKLANISRSPLYYYYSSKQELFKHVCQRYFDEYLEKMDRLYNEHPEQTIYERYFQLFMESLVPYYVKGSTLSTQILQGGEELSELKELNSAYFSELRKRDMQALTRAQERGEIRGDANLESVVNFYYTVYLGLRAPKLQEEFESKQHLEEVCWLAVHMLENLYAPEGWEKDRFRHK